MRYSFEKYCKNYQNIENYQEAKKDNFKGWECHHRLETHNSDGERRLVDISQKELIALNMYYNRPAEELIFLTVKEHNAFRKGKPKSEETKKKMSSSWDYDKHFTEETRKKMSEAQAGEKNPMYGKRHTEETKKKMSEVKTGENHPMYGRHHSEESKKKMSEAKKNMRWYNNGEKCVRAKECPEGFIPGRLLIK